MRVWELGPGRLMVSGAFSDLAVHHHAAVQITVGARGPLAITRDGDAHDMCRVVVVGSGARHAVRSATTSEPLTLYFGLQTPQGAALNARPRHGVWLVDDAQDLAETAAALLDADGPDTAADFLVERLAGTQDARGSVHPQLRQAIEVVSSRVPDHIDVASVAGAVALSPDYLGRLCKQQTGVSFSATIRWERLVTAVGHLVDGRSVTDAAHLAGFADGSHANRVCWEMTGLTPRDFARAVRDSI
ncbi:helix-turn-helix transcriptional regulator [Mycobacterium sp. Aquia_216]|uniref:helix-turn-helix transcriptional regulator n=1 Tax=Mycobacterium sp. Aquia_216 TaxID=2991729 RepID=UPI00227A5443|nr:helix-turn-helix transcriptional regulator [Mycobacterium sp. Aquia_216]WAJ46293.1 helix-turn-helix transcriptional regulator [Mycobacterium sp. Aquia_216]